MFIFLNYDKIATISYLPTFEKSGNASSQTAYVNRGHTGPAPLGCGACPRVFFSFSGDAFQGNNIYNKTGQNLHENIIK